eukprot:scaffold3032_cov375-Prasinococcus_capsulatus_cf.AAC.12
MALPRCWEQLSPGWLVGGPPCSSRQREPAHSVCRSPWAELPAYMYSTLSFHWRGLSPSTGRDHDTIMATAGWPPGHVTGPESHARAANSLATLLSGARWRGARRHREGRMRTGWDRTLGTRALTITRGCRAEPWPCGGRRRWARLWQDAPGVLWLAPQVTMQCTGRAGVVAWTVPSRRGTAPALAPRGRGATSLRARVDKGVVRGCAFRFPRRGEPPLRPAARIVPGGRSATDAPQQQQQQQQRQRRRARPQDDRGREARGKGQDAGGWNRSRGFPGAAPSAAGGRCHSRRRPDVAVQALHDVRVLASRLVERERDLV